MRDHLYEFLILNKKLSLPGIGTIRLSQKTAQHDYADRLFIPPSFFFTLDPKEDQPSKKLFDWLSAFRGISEWEAIKSVNDFSLELTKILSQDGEVKWEKLGILSRDNNGEIRLDSQVISLAGEHPVVADKVIRQKAGHTVLVGERERTSVEMEELLAQIPPKRNYAWVLAIILTVISIMFIGLYFSEKGFSPASAGNQSLLKTN